VVSAAATYTRIERGWRYPPNLCGHEWFGSVAAVSAQVQTTAQGDPVVGGVATGCAHVPTAPQANLTWAQAERIRPSGNDDKVSPHVAKPHVVDDQLNSGVAAEDPILRPVARRRDEEPVAVEPNPVRREMRPPVRPDSCHGGISWLGHEGIHCFGVDRRRTHSAREGHVG